MTALGRSLGTYYVNDTFNLGIIKLVGLNQVTLLHSQLIRSVLLNYSNLNDFNLTNYLLTVQGFFQGEHFPPPTSKLLLLNCWLCLTPPWKIF